MDQLNALLREQYRQYRNRMNYIGWHLRWSVKIPLLPMQRGQ